jgi:glycerophosphoryl diester phosphodiesterase
VATLALPRVRPSAPELRGTYGSHPGPLAAAHRGGAGLAPENTLAAFRRATDLGLTYLETDVRTTADGVALAFHDATLDRVTSLRGAVAERTWAEIRGARVLGTEPLLPLEDLLGALPDACVMIDVKEERAIAPTIAAVRRTGAAGRVCVAGGWDAWLAAIRRECGPELTTALGWRSLSALIACARAGVRPPAAVATGAFAHVAWRLGHLDVMARPRVAARVVQMAHGLGVRVVGWTIDDAALIHRLLDDGVDGVITDRPDVMRDVLLARGAGAPAW